MSRHPGSVACFGLALVLAAGAGRAAPVTPNLGPIHGEGTLADNDGNAGTWSIDAVLTGGDFAGRGTVTLRGVTVNGALKRGRSYLENGKCYFHIEQDRHRMEISGPCTTDSIAGRADGFLAGEGVIIGSAKGVLRFGRAGAPKPAATAATGVLPTNKLTCAWSERIGGNVAGDPARYELRFSNMVTLTLGRDGSYRTNKAAGRYVREGNTVRLTSGAFAGAVGRLEPDRSGQPAVYFERDENRRPNGVHIVDPGRTSCTTARGG
ncbi:hypothetical protein E2493_12930 [Sphingomonas parva]|uniref:OstA family protein n=1 Tax=Sphingomonas parva TaxID=2555898 RepID=A0A4Y8ZTT8_9SPHN|nr:hypothetical protein [Sphingomonas parva]TFI57886.1 hypothetical protein E2493_12930 [Sphingomonas parva]